MSTKKNAPLTVGDFIKNYRLGEDLTQTELALKLGLSKQRLCDIEKDRSNLSIQLCKKIAKKLDVPTEWLVKLAIQEQLDQENIDLKVA